MAFPSVPSHCVALRFFPVFVACATVGCLPFALLPGEGLAHFLNLAFGLTAKFEVIFSLCLCIHDDNTTACNLEWLLLIWVECKETQCKEKKVKEIHQKIPWHRAFVLKQSQNKQASMIKTNSVDQSIVGHKLRN